MTFDDGPFPESTPELLKWLEEAEVQATFFLIAEQVQAHPELFRKIVEAGHGVGLHGLRHRSLVLMTAAECEAELKEGRRILEAALGEPLSVLLLRPPYGFRSLTLIHTADRLGWTIVGWSNDPQDYFPDRRRKRVSVSVGDIVLLHERPGPRRINGPHPDPLDAVVASARASGLTFVTLNKACSRRGIVTC